MTSCRLRIQDGVGAVNVARQERPDVVLLDIGLPGGGGISVLDRYANWRRSPQRRFRCSRTRFTIAHRV